MGRGARKPSSFSFTVAIISIPRAVWKRQSGISHPFQKKDRISHATNGMDG